MTLGEAVLKKLESAYARYMKLEEGLPLVLALWNLHTHMYKDFHVTPYLWVHSPVRGCGKTTLCLLLHLLSANAEFTVNISKPSLFRTIQQLEPTLILDEADGLLRDRELLSIVNAGYSRSTGYVARVYKNEIHRYPTYCPKVIASIQPIPHTVVDRSIKIELQRLLEGDKVMPFYEDDDSVGRDMLPAMHDWVSKHRNQIARIYRSPGSHLGFLHARQADIWRPLFAIAQVLCPERLEELRATALRLTDEKRQFEQETSPELNLLRGCRQVLENLKNPEKFSTEIFITGLASLPESAWGNITALDLSKKLLPFGIRPAQLWIRGRNFRGYTAASFQDAFARYLEKPATPPRAASAAAQGAL
jgi:hypothetical protein